MKLKRIIYLEWETMWLRFPGNRRKRKKLGQPVKEVIKLPINKHVYG